jgi:Rad3-related DNA helicase
MNAPNPLMPESRPLSEATLELLRRAIQERRQSPAGGDTALQAALQVVASEARERSLRPEELIVALKQLIDEAPGIRSLAGEDRRLREWIVTTCIRAYFEGT